MDAGDSLGGDAPPETIGAADAVEIDTRVHPLTVVRRACYALADRAWFWIRPTGEQLLRVEIAPRDQGADRLALRRDLSEALIDFGLRAEIEARTAGLRDTLALAALLETDSPR